MSESTDNTKKSTNLFELITKSEDEIHLYLCEVSVNNFVSDVKSLVNEKLDKVIIEQTIERLKLLLND